MKAARCILKTIAVLAAVAAVVAAIVTYWDKILDVYYKIVDKIEEKRAACAFCDPDFDDVDFVDEEDSAVF